MSEPELQNIISSPEADRMRRMATEGFYDRSRIGLWMYEVIGREWDDMAEWSRTLKHEIYPLSCTWSIADWEFVYGYEPDETMTLQARRERLLLKRRAGAPISPAFIEQTLSKITGCPVIVTDPIKAYTFAVEVRETLYTIYDFPDALRTLRAIKPSHLSFEWKSIVREERKKIDYSMGFTFERIRETFWETPELKTDVVDTSMGVTFERIRETFGENAGMKTDIFDTGMGVTFERIKETFQEVVRK